MYTGTVIRDLMAAVQRAEQRAAQQQMEEEKELRAIFAMQIPLNEGDRVLMGAA